MATSIKDVAQAAQVSTASVSIYLNDPNTNRVSKAKKEVIDHWVKKLNYRKNIMASSLSGGSGKIVGVIIPTIQDLFRNVFTNSLLSGAQNVLKENGYGMLFIPSSSNVDYHSAVEQQLRDSGGCCGYLLFSTGFCTIEQVQDHIQSLERAGKPFVTLNVPELDLDISQVVIPGLSSLSSLEYLYKKEHRNILIVLGRPGGLHVRQYLARYRNFLKKKGIPFNNDLIVYGNYSDEETRQAVNSFIGKNVPFTAVCCASDLMATSVMNVLMDHGLSIPGDVSVTGLDNSLYSRLARPRITTIDLHVYEAGRNAGKLLLEQVEETRTRRKIIMDEQLIEGDSVQKIEVEAM